MTYLDFNCFYLKVHIKYEVTRFICKTVNKPEII